MPRTELINSEALTWLWEQPDDSVAGVVTDPPEEEDCPNLRTIIQECLRVSRGPVIAVAPLVWDHEGAEHARHRPTFNPEPDSYAYWLASSGPWRGVAPILCWRANVKNIKTPLPLLAATGHKPALKPVALFRDLVDVIGDGPILDPFCGEGTCAVACLRAGIDHIGLDLNADAVERAEGRCTGSP